jgi:hypothetical protein
MTMNSDIRAGCSTAPTLAVPGWGLGSGSRVSAGPVTIHRTVYEPGTPSPNGY